MNFNNLLVLFLVLFGLTSCGYDVPLMAWSNKDLKMSKSLPHTIRSSSDLQNLLDSYKSITSHCDRVVLLDFLKLSLLDFNQFSSHMNYLHSQADKMDYRLVSSPVSMHDWQRHLGSFEVFNVSIESPLTFVDLIPESKSKNLQINLESVHLTDAKSAGQRFAFNDKIIAKLADRFVNETVLYILTSRSADLDLNKRSSLSGAAQTTKEQFDHLQLSESELDSAYKDVQQKLRTSGLINDGELVIASNCSQIYLNLVELIYFDTNDNSTNFCGLTLDPASVTGVCDSDIELRFNAPADCPVSTVDIKLNFDVQYNSWQCNTTTGFLTINDAAKTTQSFNSSCQSIYAPYQLSYSCFKTKFFLGFVGAKFYHLQLNNYQVQPTQVLGQRFNAANDCVGFFTVPIIMALLISFFVTLILAWALTLLFSCQSTTTFEKKEHFAIFGE